MAFFGRTSAGHDGQVTAQIANGTGDTMGHFSCETGGKVVLRGWPAHQEHYPWMPQAIQGIGRAFRAAARLSPSTLVGGTASSKSLEFGNDPK